MATYEHKNAAPNQVTCAVITVSDTRSKDTDKSGQQIIEMLSDNSYPVKEYEIIKDNFEEIQVLIKRLASDDQIQAILLNGGTGISIRDTTYEAVQHLLEKEMPGFGELFRMLSYQNDIGSAAMLSRAVAGVYGNTAIFSMPGSSGAVKLAMNELIIPELRHVRYEIEKQL